MHSWGLYNVSITIIQQINETIYSPVSGLQLEALSTSQHHTLKDNLIKENSRNYWPQPSPWWSVSMMNTKIYKTKMPPITSVTILARDNWHRSTPLEVVYIATPICPKGGWKHIRLIKVGSNQSHLIIIKWNPKPKVPEIYYLLIKKKILEFVIKS